MSPSLCKKGDSARPPISALPVGLQRDIRSFFGSYSNACRLADDLLFRAGSAESVDEACRRSAVGKLLPTALYVHRTALEALDPLLRVYEGCARAYLGTLDGANLIKLHRHSGKVSYLFYPDFETDPHPAYGAASSIPGALPRAVLLMPRSGQEANGAFCVLAPNGADTCQPGATPQDLQRYQERCPVRAEHRQFRHLPGAAGAPARSIALTTPPAPTRQSCTARRRSWRAITRCTPSSPD